MSVTIDGLVSGLDTTSIINQLMGLDRAPVTQMQARQSTFDRIANAWDDIAGKVSALRTTAEAIDTPAELALSTAASSDSSILTASAGTGAVAGPVTLQVQSLAVAHQVMSSGFASSAATVGAGTAVISAGLRSIGATGASASADFTAGAHTVTVTQSGGAFLASLDGGTAVSITAGSPVTLGGPTGTLTLDFGATPAAGTSKISVVRTTAAGTTLAQLATAISTAGGPATAQVIDLGAGAGSDPPARLILTATQTGTAGALTVDLSGFTGLDNSALSDLRPAGDATVKIGSLTATRSSNTINDLLPGLTLNLARAAPGTDVTVSVGSDDDAVVGKVKALVAALNGVQSGIARYASYDADTKTAGVLLSDPNARSLTFSLASTVGAVLPAGAYRTLSQLGVSINRDGSYSLDETKLRAALDADPAGAGTSIAALAKPLATWAQHSDGVTGVAYLAKSSAQSQSKDIGNQIASFQVFLDQRQAMYQRQFSALETTLGQLKDQSSWLAGQIAHLG